MWYTTQINTTLTFMHLQLFFYWRSFSISRISRASGNTRRTLRSIFTFFFSWLFYQFVIIVNFRTTPFVEIVCNQAIYVIQQFHRGHRYLHILFLLLLECLPTVFISLVFFFFYYHLRLQQVHLIKKDPVVKSERFFFFTSYC